MNISEFRHNWNERLQPDHAYTYGSNPEYRISQRWLAIWVGMVAVGLPFVMLIGTALLDACYRDSISSYYFSLWTGDIFVIQLAFIGTFLIAYRGENWWENLFATFAGFAALLVALFPTSGSGCGQADGYAGRLVARLVPDPDPSMKVLRVETLDDVNLYFVASPMAGTIHGVSAALLFIFLAWYCLVVFTRSTPDQKRPDGKLTREKWWRNLVYHFSGGMIVLSLVALGMQALLEWRTDLDFTWWDDSDVTFWLESLALWAFGVSWIVKGAGLAWFIRDEKPSQPFTPGGDATAA